LPVIIPTIISISLFFLDSESPTRERAINSLLFFGLELLFHWVPLLTILLLLKIAGVM